MHRTAVILLLLAGGGLLADSGPAVGNPDESELAERVRAHICVVFRNRLVLVKTQFGLPEGTPQLPR
jgi:hypothetical protein